MLRILPRHRFTSASALTGSKIPSIDRGWIIFCEGKHKCFYTIAPMATNSSEGLRIPSTSISFLILCSDREGERSRGRAPTPSQQVSICAKRWCSPEKKRSRTKASKGLIMSYELGVLCPSFTLVAGFSRRLFPGNGNMAQIIIRKCPFSHILRHEGVWDYSTNYLRTNPTYDDDSM